MAVITKAEWLKVYEKLKLPKAGGAKIGGLLDDYHAAGGLTERIAATKDLPAALIAHAKSLDQKDDAEHQLAGYIGTNVLPGVNKALAKYREADRDLQNLTAAQVFKDREVLALLLAYAKKEYNLENVEFVLAVDKGMAKKQIYNDFIASKAPDRVNLPSEEYAALDELAAADKFSAMDFKDARARIVKLIDRDILPRFIKSKEMQARAAEDAGADA